MSRRAAAARPRIGVSRCLLQERVRYNGAVLSAPGVAALAADVEFVGVCPEVELGLGVPRPAIELVGTPDTPRLVQPSTGRDLTDAMATFATTTVARLSALDGWVLKARSPSCAVHDAPVFAHGSAAGEAEPPRGPGAFARAVLAAAPALPVVDEDELSDAAARAEFLVRVRARAARRSGDLGQI